jgi:hypothetical protein
LPDDKAESRYAAVVRALAREPGVTHDASGRKGFGSSGQLKVDNRIFAMLVRGSLVVKLPAARVASLVQMQQGHQFDPRRNGRLMKEWVVLPVALERQWLPLAREALAFVRLAK